MFRGEPSGALDVTGGGSSGGGTITGTVGAYQSGAWAVGITGAVTGPVTVTGTVSVAGAIAGPVTVTGVVGAFQSGAWTVAASQSGAWSVTATGVVGAFQSGAWTVTPYSASTSFVYGAITASMTGTASTSLIAAATGSNRNYVTWAIVSNAHATVGTDVILQDGSGGTTLATLPAAALYGGAAVTFPVPLRTTAATALFAQNVTTGASTKVTAGGYTAL